MSRLKIDFRLNNIQLLADSSDVAKDSAGRSAGGEDCGGDVL